MAKGAHKSRTKSQKGRSRFTHQKAPHGAARRTEIRKKAKAESKRNRNR